MPGCANTPILPYIRAHRVNGAQSQKAEKEAAPKASHKELKARFADDLKKFKDTSNAKFIMDEERQVALDLHEFKVRQMERHHAFEQEQFEEVRGAARRTACLDLPSVAANGAFSVLDVVCAPPRSTTNCCWTKRSRRRRAGYGSWKPSLPCCAPCSSSSTSCCRSSRSRSTTPSWRSSTSSTSGRRRTCASGTRYSL